MQTFIVATDFSPIADNATQYAIDAASVINARIILFHLHKLSAHASGSLVTAPEIARTITRRKEEADKQAMRLASEYQVEIIAEVRMGDFTEEVTSVIEQYDGSILVMGMPEKSFEQDMLGNTTTAAIYKLRFPILSVPASATYSGIRKILFACDLTRGIHAQVLDTVKTYARLFGAAVEIFFVGDAVRRLQEEALLGKHFEGVSYIYKNVRSASVIAAIRQEAGQINADLLIMTPHKYGFWASMVHRSKTRAMASNGRIPLLSIAY